MEDQESKSSTKDYEGKTKIMVLTASALHAISQSSSMRHAALSQLGNFETENTARYVHVKLFSHHRAATANLRDSQPPVLNPWRL